MENIDFIKGGIWPLQTYGWSGTQFGPSSSEAINGKSPTTKPPIVVTSQPPGAAARDNSSWLRAYGASHDCVLSLLDGTFVEESTSSQTITGIYKDAMPHLQDMSLLRDAKLESGDQVQQVQYMISKQTVAEAQTVAKTNNAGTESEIRSIGMRMPMMMAGWGKTIAMRPTDPEPTTDENKRKNDEEHKVARETWKHGVVDLRWDERRGVWAAWNDLIADHEDKNLGTFVFSTNPDAVCGFPFLRGRLEDVWKVLRTPDKDAGSDTAGQEDDTTQTGEVCTHMDHKLYDGGSITAGRLTDVFVAGVDNFGGAAEGIGVGSGPRSSAATCGTEETVDGSLFIRTTAAFQHSPGGIVGGKVVNAVGGTIRFEPEDPRDSPNDIWGAMKLIPTIGWVPTISFDEAAICEIEGFKNINTTLFNNDSSLQDTLETVIDAHNKISGGAGVFQLFADISVDFGSVSQSASSADAALAVSVQAALQKLATACEKEITTARQDICAQVNLCLEHLGCICIPGSASIDPPPPIDVTSVNGGTFNEIFPVEGSIAVPLTVPLVSNTAVINNPCP